MSIEIRIEGQNPIVYTGDDIKLWRHDDGIFDVRVDDETVLTFRKELLILIDWNPVLTG